MDACMKPEKILVIEDTDFIAELLIEIFTKEGYAVKWAHDAEEALAALIGLVRGGFGEDDDQLMAEEYDVSDEFDVTDGAAP